MRRLVVFTPLHPIMLLLMVLLMFVSVSAYTIIILSYWSVFEEELTPVGLKGFEALIVAYTISLASIVLSPVNVVIKEFREEYLVPSIEFVVYFGLPIPVPRLRFRRTVSLLTVNVGGALIPILISLFILARFIQLGYIDLLLRTIIALIVVTVVTYISSKPIPGVGIVSPMFIPPLTATLTSILVALEPLHTFPIAYISGTLGTLLGADILHLITDWSRIRAQIVSIGGAGTFDGIYLTGVISTILLAILIL